MSEVKYTVLEIWPELKEDMTEFLSNPYKWLESALEQTIVPPESRGIPNRRKLELRDLNNLLDILKTVNAIYSPSLKTKI